MAQPYEEMFERNVGHVASRGKEVEVWVEGLPSPKVGFLAGLDDEFLQVCITDTQTLSNVRRDSVVSMDETGRTIGTLITGAKGTSKEESVLHLRDKVKHFQSKATHLYGRSR